LFYPMAKNPDKLTKLEKELEDAVEAEIPNPTK
jgi:hypothetical protein